MKESTELAVLKQGSFIAWCGTVFLDVNKVFQNDFRIYNTV